MGRSQLRPRMSKSRSTLSCRAEMQTSRGQSRSLITLLGTGYLCAGSFRQPFGKQVHVGEDQHVVKKSEQRVLTCLFSQAADE